MIRRHRGTTAVIAATALLATSCGFELVRDQDAATESSAVTEEDTGTSDVEPVDRGDEPDPTVDATEDDEATDDDLTPEDSQDDTSDDDDGQDDDGQDEGPSTDGDDEDAPTEVLGSARGNDPYTEVRVLDLRRHGDQAVLDFEIEFADGDEDHHIIHEFFDRDLTPDVNSVSGVTVLDLDNGTRHFVLVDEEGNCLCTSFNSSWVTPGDTVVHNARFPAPPDGVDAMTVDVPHFPLIDDVPLRDAS